MHIWTGKRSKAILRIIFSFILRRFCEIGFTFKILKSGPSARWKFLILKKDGYGTEKSRPLCWFQKCNFTWWKYARNLKLTFKKGKISELGYIFPSKTIFLNVDLFMCILSWRFFSYVLKSAHTFRFSDTYYILFQQQKCSPLRRAILKVLNIKTDFHKNVSK
jgi:hypothetical protein